MNSFGLEKQLNVPHSLAHLKCSVCVRMTDTQIKNVYIRNDFTQPRMHTSSIRNNEFHDLTIIKIIIPRFVDTGGSLIRYPNGHT